MAATHVNTTLPTSPELIRLRSNIDESIKSPVLFLFLNAAFWLMASTILGFLASAKLAYPSLISDCLTYSKLQPIHMNALVYGWGVQSALGILLWVSARRTHTFLEVGHAVLKVAAIFWNITLTAGLIGIFLGKGSAMELLEMPKFTWLPMLLCYLPYAWVVTRMFARRYSDEGYLVSVWYAVGAALWFPWIFVTANVCLNCIPGGLGALGTGINAWYSNALIVLFFTPVSLAAAYYFIPKITAQPVGSRALAQVGFWGLAVMGGWVGMQRFFGGPLAAWTVAASSAAGVMLLVPTILVSWNYHVTTVGKHHLIQTSPTLRFVFTGSLFYLVSGFLYLLLSAVTTGASFQFTQAWYGYQIAAIYGFYSMCAFGAIYFIVPRLTGTEWLSAGLIRWHFWIGVYGIAAIVIISFVAGSQQADDLNSPAMWDQSFQTNVDNLCRYMPGKALGWLLIAVSNFFFLAHIMLMVAGLGRRSINPTLLPKPHHEDVHSH
jgi:cytochrome c oxidase cbb3-type subunit 1